MRSLTLCFLFIATPLAADELQSSLAVLKQVGGEGQGNDAAAKAWQTVAVAPMGSLLPILAALDGANDLSANYIRSAIDALVERETAKGAALPATELEAFLKDASHNPRGRRLAFELLAKVDPKAPDRIIPTMLDDPSVELRRDAVQRLVDQADKGGADAAKLYEQAFAAARDQDQINAIVEKLLRLNRPVDLPKHYGFIQNWMLIGPFDNTQMKGFARVFPPEENPASQPNFNTELPGKTGHVLWREHMTKDKHGVVDLNKALGKASGVTAYAWHEFTSESARPVELRLGCIVACKVWLNGDLLFAREEYHSGMFLDQYRIKGALRPGKNVILVKVCQNEQKEDWAQDWKFQLRVCDPVGTAVLSTTRPAAPAADAGKSTSAQGTKS